MTTIIRGVKRTVRQNQQGPTGPAGVVWDDAGWQTSTIYAKHTGLLHNGSSYRSIIAHTSAAGTEPGVGASWETAWELLASKGETGDEGPIGPQGATGPYMLGYATKALLDADLNHPEKTLAQVCNDTTTANNGTYRKVGASGAGSWVQAVLQNGSMVYYADASRPDDSGDGLSLATAKKTIQAAINAAAAGSVIKVAAGTYRENDPTTKTINVGKNITLEATGTATLVATSGAARIIYISGAAILTMAGPWIIDGESARPWFVPAGSHTGKLVCTDGVSFVNGTGGFVNYPSRVELTDCTVTAGTFTVFTPASAGSTLVSGGSIYSNTGTVFQVAGSGALDVSGVDITAVNCAVNIVTSPGTGAVTFTGNTITASGSTTLFNRQGNSAVTIDENEINFALSATNNIVFNSAAVAVTSAAGSVTNNTVNILGTARTSVVFVQYGVVVITGNSISVNGVLSQATNLIHIKNQSCTIHDNLIDILNATPSTPILVESTGSSIIPDVRRNTIKTRALSGYTILIGSDADPVANRQKCDGAIVEGNTIYGPNYFGTVDTPADNTLHGILLGWSLGSIRKNYINGSGYGVLVKSDGLDRSTSEGMHTNVVLNCSQSAVRVKGCKNTKIYANTMVSESSKPAVKLCDVTYNQDVGAQNPLGGQGSQIKNNVMLGKSGAALLSIDSFAAPSTVANNNSYRYFSGAALSVVIGATTYSSLAQLQAAGFEANGKEVDPLVVSGIYELTSASPLRDSGASLGLTTDYFGRSRSTPPDIGAMEYV